MLNNLVPVLEKLQWSAETLQNSNLPFNIFTTLQAVKILAILEAADRQLKFKENKTKIFLYVFLQDLAQTIYSCWLQEREQRDPAGALDWLYSAALHLPIYSAIKTSGAAPPPPAPPGGVLPQTPLQHLSSGWSLSTVVGLASQARRSFCLLEDSKNLPEKSHPQQRRQSSCSKTNSLRFSKRQGTAALVFPTACALDRLFTGCFWVLSNVWSGVRTLGSGTACDCYELTCTYRRKVGRPNSVESHNLFVLCLENTATRSPSTGPKVLPLPT